MNVDRQTHVAEIERTAAERADEDPAAILAAWINEHPRFRLYRSRLSYAEGLTLAYRQMFSRDLKLVNEVVTGGCFWPPEGTVDELATECRALIADQKTLIALDLIPAVDVRRCQIAAAHGVLSDLTQIEAAPRQDYGVDISDQLVGRENRHGDLYRCGECGAQRVGDLPDCPRGTLNRCDVLVGIEQ